MSNKELKEKYNKLFNVVKKIVNDWDPIGLLPSAPVAKKNMERDKISGVKFALTDGFDRKGKCIYTRKN